MSMFSLGHIAHHEILPFVNSGSAHLMAGFLTRSFGTPDPETF